MRSLSCSIAPLLWLTIPSANQLAGPGTVMSKTSSSPSRPTATTRSQKRSELDQIFSESSLSKSAYELKVAREGERRKLLLEKVVPRIEPTCRLVNPCAL